MPAVDEGFAVIELNGQAVVCGGDSRGRISCMAYDPISKRWAHLPAMSVDRFDCAAAVVDGKIFVAGGCNTTLFTDTAGRTAEVCDPTTGQWTRLPDMKEVRSGAVAVSLGASLQWQEA